MKLVRILIPLAAALVTFGSASAAHASDTNPPPHPPLLSYRDQLGPAARTSGTAQGVRLRNPYSLWNWGSAYASDITETFNVASATPGAPLFWSHQFTFQRGKCAGTNSPCQGYFGLQQGGGRTGAKVAIFSVWDADAATGADCATFGGEGVGYSCRLDPFAWKAGHDYAIRVRVETSNAKGVWYLATIADTTAKTAPQAIGRIHVPPGRGGIQGWTSWTEYFGNTLPTSCAAFPKGQATFRNPTAAGHKLLGKSSTTGAGDCASEVRNIPGGQTHLTTATPK